MNWQHLTAFVWLRWRLMANQWRRAGAFNAALMIIVAISLVATAIPILIGSFACWCRWPSAPARSACAKPWARRTATS